MPNTESLSSKWDFAWQNLISALRSGSATRIAIARADLAEVNREIG